MIEALNNTQLTILANNFRPAKESGLLEIYEQEHELENGTLLAFNAQVICESVRLGIQQIYGSNASPVKESFSELGYIYPDGRPSPNRLYVVKHLRIATRQVKQQWDKGITTHFVSRDAISQLRPHDQSWGILGSEKNRIAAGS